MPAAIRRRGEILAGRGDGALFRFDRHAPNGKRNSFFVPCLQRPPPLLSIVLLIRVTMLSHCRFSAAG
jgi:hypothetical protein